MFTTTLINVDDVHVNVLRDMYNSNQDVIDSNSRCSFENIQHMFTQRMDNKLTAVITRNSDGTIAGYTTGNVKNEAYHCTNVVVSDNKAFILSSDSFCEVLLGQNIKYIKGHVKVNTPMYNFMLNNLGRDDLFSAQAGSPVEGHDGVIVTLTLL